LNLAAVAAALLRPESDKVEAEAALRNKRTRVENQAVSICTLVLVKRVEAEAALPNKRTRVENLAVSICTLVLAVSICTLVLVKRVNSTPAEQTDAR
jgi:hypothetical protein